MTIIADPTYLQNDRTKLARNTYRKRDADFTGIMLYFTPKGKFLSAYAYREGKLITPSLHAAVALKPTMQSLSGSPLKTIALVAPPADCIDWYWDTYVNGQLLSEVYLYTTCADGPPQGGGGGAPAPCDAPHTNSMMAHVNVVQPPIDGGGDDPGFPDPTPVSCPAPTDEDASVTNNIKNPCLRQMTNDIITAGVKNEVSTLISSVFSGAGTPVLNFEDSQTLLPSNIAGRTDAIHTGIASGSTLISATITLNDNNLPIASKEYIAATIIHETLHAYLDNTNRGNSSLSHEAMAQNYFSSMSSSLMQMFPNLSQQDAEALTWGGLEDTLGYRYEISADLEATYSTINSNYFHGTKGQPCSN